MIKRAIEMEGTVTGEHGVGLIKRDYLPHELGDSTVDLMRKVGTLLVRHFSLHRKLINVNVQLKISFDPLCLLNPDKIVRIEKPKKGEIAEW
jgi:D-lactate dehydrogenase (cytochrome)